MQEQQQQQDTSAWTPVDEKAWSAVPEQQPEKGFVAGVKRGFADDAATVTGIPGAIKSAWNAGVRDNDRPQMDVARDAIAGAKQIPGKLKAMNDAADKEWQDDPGGFVGHFLSGTVLPAVAGESVARGLAGVARPLAVDPEVSAAVKAAAQQANADPLKLKLLQAQSDAKKALNLQLAQVTGKIDKAEPMIPRTTVYSEMTKQFGDDLNSAPLDVSRLIADSTKERGVLDAYGQPVGTNMRFGELENMRQSLQDHLRLDPNNAALKGAHGAAEQMLNDIAGKQGLAKDYKDAKNAIEDFHTNVVPRGGIIDQATAPTSENYKKIMEPLTDTSLPAKVQKLKDLGADIDPQDVAARVQAYKTYEKHGNTIAEHSRRPFNMLEVGGGAVGGYMGHKIGGWPGGVVGYQMGKKAVRAIGDRLGGDAPMPMMPPE